MHADPAAAAATMPQIAATRKHRCAVVLIGATAVLLGLTAPGPAWAATARDYTTDAFQRDCLHAHNGYRKRHAAPALVTDPALVAFAKKRANKLATTEIFAHDAGNYGENLAWNWSSAGAAPVACAAPVKNWYDEVKDVTWDDPERNWSRTGHFTQVVWRGTTKLGCAQAGAINGKKGGTYTVCNYDPAGNMMGDFAENVRRDGS
ncbi:CAP family protein [Nocardia asiatica]|uniref:CAP family protein n=2 Tax=Nocardia asiatica TaxID=209252 RepID=UPI0024548D05|nr:CAP family protein [Nocardia asiatica]